MMAAIFPFVAIAILILINGLFVAAEFAIISVRPTRIEQLIKGGNRRAGWVKKTLDDRSAIDRYIATAQLGITLASLGLGMYAEPAIAHLIEGPLHDWFGLQGTIVHTIGFIIALTIITYLHVVFGEMVPKSLSLQNAERTVLALTGPMMVASKFFSIPVKVLNSIGLLVLRMLRVPPPEEGSRFYTPEELELIVSESAELGLIAEHEQALVANILDFAEERVEQVMRPRTQMMAIPTTALEETILQIASTAPYSRLPLYEGTIDNITGMIHIKDLIRQQLDGQPFDLAALRREVSYVPESLPVKTLLADLQKTRRQMAIVLDEHGGTLGLVTLEDLLEEIVGEVWDEFDVEAESPLVEVGPGQYQAQGSVHLADIRKVIDLGQIGHDVQTLGGLIWAELCRRPEVGEELSIGAASLRIEAIDGLAISKVFIRCALDSD